MDVGHLNVLLIDDHPLFTKLLKDTITDVGIEESMTINTVEVHSSSRAMEVLKNSTSLNSFDFIFLDIKLPTSMEHDIVNGEDIALFIRKTHPETKIVIITTYNEPYRIGTLIRQLEPYAFLVKSDLHPKEFYSNIRQIILGDKLFSSTVNRVMQSYTKKEYQLDEIDRRLLYELSSGASLKEIAEIIPLSRSALAKRKSQLREQLNVGSTENRKLIETARELGLI